MTLRIDLIQTGVYSHPSHRDTHTLIIHWSLK